MLQPALLGAAPTGASARTLLPPSGPRGPRVVGSAPPQAWWPRGGRDRATSLRARGEHGLACGSVPYARARARAPASRARVVQHRTWTRALPSQPSLRGSRTTPPSEHLRRSAAGAMLSAGTPAPRRGTRARRLRARGAPSGARPCRRSGSHPARLRSLRSSLRQPGAPCQQPSGYAPPGPTADRRGRAHRACRRGRGGRSRRTRRARPRPLPAGRPRRVARRSGTRRAATSAALGSVTPPCPGPCAARSSRTGI